MEESKDYLEPLDLGTPRSQGNPAIRVVEFAFFIALAITSWRYMGPKSALASGGWIDNWEAAVGQAKSSGKPALVLFTADWCPACRQLESETLTDPAVKQYLKDNHTLIIVDLTERAGPNAQRAQAFSVGAIPTLILFDAAGVEKARTFGMPSDSLLKWLKR